MRAVRVSMFSLCIPTHGTVVCITSCFSSDHTGNYTRKIYPVNSNCFFFFSSSPVLAGPVFTGKRNSCLNKSSFTFRVCFLLGAVVLRSAHLDLNQRANDATSMLGQMPGAQDLQRTKCDYVFGIFVYINMLLHTNTQCFSISDIL